MNRPQWHDYFMALTVLVAQRSLDPATKCGCVITDKENTILSIGYNSPPRGCDDEKVPLTRPEKYGYMVHAELAAITNACRNGTPLKDGILYCNVKPCHLCTGHIKNTGISKIVYGNFSAKCIDDESNRISTFILSDKKIELIEYKRDKFLEVFYNSIDYSKSKLSIV